jgi:hypothetical protein
MVRDSFCRPLAGTGLSARYESHRLEAVVCHSLTSQLRDRASFAISHILRARIILLVVAKQGLEQDSDRTVAAK